MKDYERKIIQYLNNHSQVTAASLSNYLGVSIRSIKNYIRELNTSYPNIIISSNKGYSLCPSSHNNDFKRLETNQIPQTSLERINYITNKLIKSDSKNPVNIYDLCESLFVSLSTCKSDISKAKKIYNKYNLTLHAKGDLLYIEGIEKNKRKLFSSILYDESVSNFINYVSLQAAFPSIDIELIRKIVLSNFKEYHYFISDYSLTNLILHIAICIDRIRDNNTVSSDPITPSTTYLLPHEYEIAKKIAAQLETNFLISFTDAEIYEMALLLISRATNIQYKNVPLTNLEKTVGKDCVKLVQQLCDNIRIFYNIDIDEPEFIIRFTLHIHNLLIRSKNNYFNKNPLCNSIKSTCPFIYDVSVSLAQTIREKTDILINDDEIAYIAFHLGGFLETKRDLESKISTILYCPSYYDMGLRIAKRINQFFSEDILIVNILTEESELTKLAETDLIISILPIDETISVPFEIVTLMINEHDQQLIKNRILKLQSEKKRKRFEVYLKRLIIPDLFERKQGLYDKAECISYMVNKLEAKHYVNPSFHSEILEREQLSTTAFGSVAIPHSMRMHAFKTGISVIISDHPILWDKNHVQLILMMSFSKDDRYIFNEIFEPLSMILTDQRNIRTLISCLTYDEFIKTLIQLL